MPIVWAGNSNGSGNLTFGLTGSTVTGSAPSAGGGFTMNEYMPFELGNNTTFSSAGQSSLYFQKLWPTENYTFSVAERYASVSFSSNTNNQSLNYSIHYGVYKRDAGTNSTRMTLENSSSMGIYAAYSSNTSGSISIVQGATNWQTNSGGTGIFANFSGGKDLYLPYAGSFAAGQPYWFGMLVMSASTVSSQVLRLAFLEKTNINNLSFGKIFASTMLVSNASYVGDFNQAVYSAQTNVLPATVADLNVTNAVSLAKQVLKFEN